MKGVKYILEFKLPNKTKIVKTDLEMKDLINNMKKLFNEYYEIDNLKISNQSIYNLIHRPEFTSKLIKSFCVVKKNRETLYNRY